MKRVVGLGANVLDTLIKCESFPKEDTKMKINEATVCGGGPVGNALVVLSKLGIDTEVIGGFSDDTSGKRILSELETFGVGIKNVTTVSGASAFVSNVIISEKTGTRTCLFDRGSVPDDPESVKYEVIDGAYILHLDGNYLKSAVRAAEYAKRAGVKVSLDAGGLYDGIEELLPLVDILIPSAEFAKGITGKCDPASALLELQKRYAPEILVVTDGANGGYYYASGTACHYDSMNIKAIDTNGAGDTFHGAFIAAYCEDMSLPECCDFASAVAAYKCLNLGARGYELNMKIAKGLLSDKEADDYLTNINRG